MRALFSHAQVYTWFLSTHNVSVGLGLLGYALLIMELFAATTIGHPLLPGGAAVMLLWYGLYFGVLGRDAAEVAADRMVGYFADSGACQVAGFSSSQ